MPQDRHSDSSRPSDAKLNAPACPICGDPATRDGEHFPFCSGRCRNVDLNRWLGGDYVITRPLEQRDLEEDA